jgi:hypothetical protein
MQRWKKKEIDDSKKFGGRRQKGSGNQWYAPGDVKTDLFLIDSKQTNNASFGVSLKIWDKIYEEALFAHRIPLLSLRIRGINLVVLDADDFEQLIKKPNPPQ